MLDNQEDNGRIVFVMKQANNSLFLNRWWCFLSKIQVSKESHIKEANEIYI
jgi:hypothetical protein